MSLGGILHAYAAATQAGPWTGLGVMFIDDRGRVLRRVGRRVAASKDDLAAFQGILCALWTARRLRARRIVVHSDNAAVVAQINGWQPVSLDLVGPYLQVRALCHAYRSASVEAGQGGWHNDALAMAETAATFDVSAFDISDVVVEDLPLWSWPSGRPPKRLPGLRGRPDRPPCFD